MLDLALGNPSLFKQALYSGAGFEADGEAASGLIVSAAAFLFFFQMPSVLGGEKTSKPCFVIILFSVIRCSSDQNMLHCTASFSRQMFHHRRRDDFILYIWGKLREEKRKR